MGTGPYPFRRVGPDRQGGDRAERRLLAHPAPLDQLVFKFVAVEAARWRRSRAESLDAYTTLVDATADAAREDGAQVAPPPTGYGGLYINLTKTSRSTTFESVRRCNSPSIVMQRLPIRARGMPDFANSPFVKDSEWWVPPETELRYDLMRCAAARRLRQAGHRSSCSPGARRSRTPSGPMSATGATSGSTPSIFQLVFDLGTYITDVLTGNYDLLGFVGNSIGDPDTIVYTCSTRPVR